MFSSYHQPSQPDSYCFENDTNAIYFYCQTYDRFFVFIGDFNAEDSEPSQFLNEHSSKNLVKGKASFKRLENPTRIDLLLTNSPLSIQNIVTISTRLLD